MSGYVCINIQYNRGLKFNIKFKPIGMATQLLEEKMVYMGIKASPNLLFHWY